MGIISLKAARALGIQIPEVSSAPTKPTSDSTVDQALWLCRWIPRSLNKMLGHHMARHRLKSQDRTIVGLQFKLSGLKPAVGRRRVDMLVVLPPGKRRIDKDNARKSLFDALTACGAILGDSPNLLAEGFVSFSRAEKLAGEQPIWGTLVILTDME